MKKYQKVSLFLAAIIAIFIFYISSLQFPPSIPSFSYTAILYHFGIFFLLSLFLLIATLNKKSFRTILSILTLILVINYAAIDEFHQLFVPNRSASIEDFAVDCTGILFSFLLISIIQIARKNK